MSIITVNSVTKRYANHTALDKVSIDVPEQSIFGLLGPNGAGKTTLIRIINQIIGPDEGEILFLGEKLRQEHVALIGYLPEERGLYKKMNVGEQALYLAQLKGVPRHEALKRLKVWFEKFEIQDWWNRKVEELSKGMQQKVQFIVTVIHQPRLLIFDEPFSGFDPINVNLIKEEIFEIQKNGGTVIFSTHNMASVEELCDHIALINRSHKILDGSVKAIKNTYKTNLFELEYVSMTDDLSGFLPPGFALETTTHNDGLSRARIKLPAGTSPNALLQCLMPHLTIHALNEIIPSMNEIFITTVNGENPDYKVNI
jgi:ABC-2 type transport system ATP-binding protein